MRAIIRIALLVAPLSLLAACAESTTAPEAPPPDTDLIAGVFGMNAGGPGSGTHACPAGGERTITSDVQVTHGEADVLVQYNALMLHNGCAVRIRDITLVTDGRVEFEGMERRALVNGQIGAVLERHSRQTGELRWRGDGHDRTCVIDITESFDPATNTRTFSGTICGGSVNFTHT
jgi:hypothetical protein